MSVVLRVENIGKFYAINRGGTPRAGSMREYLTRGIDRLLGRNDHAEIFQALAAAGQGREQDFWALRNVSFDVMAGERVGIIGANGAGKSTLLKILSRVTAPTEGRLEIHGKLASLLEVGTGFHPELTGRENIYLSGAILGMTHNEIRKKFDPIVDFSGIERFIDTPVKHYSSGMYVRLAFSVSAWLDPDILVLDEVLAVGDQAFQRKCEARMKELTREGKTVLFVSHSMAMISQMCQKALYLVNGRAVSFGSVQEGAAEYQQNLVELTEGGGTWYRNKFNRNTKFVEFSTDHPDVIGAVEGTLYSRDQNEPGIISIKDDFFISIKYELLKDIQSNVYFSINFYDAIGVIIFVCTSDIPISKKAGSYIMECRIPAFLFNTGRLNANINIVDFTATERVFLTVEAAFRFEIVESAGDDERRHGWTQEIPGVIRPRLAWSHDQAK